MSAIHAWIQGLTFAKKAFLSFVLGIAVAGALAPTYLIFLLPVSFTGVIWLLSGAQTRWQAFFIGWWFGWGQFIVGLYWIGVAFLVDAQTHALLIPLPVLGLPAVLAIFPGLTALATHMLKVKSLPRLFFFAGCWMALEYVRGTIFTGFPWNALGYSWAFFLPMLQSAAYIGIFGLTLLTVFASTVPALFVDAETSRKTAVISLVSVIGVLIALTAFGAARLATQSSGLYDQVNLRLVQPNIPQEDKWAAHLRLEHLRKLIRLSQTKTGTAPTFLVWPETAVPYYLTTMDDLKAQLAEFVPKGGAIITGAPRHDRGDDRYWNSLQVLDEKGEIRAVYDKQHLVPYGEYMPMRWLMTATGLTKVIPALDEMSDFADSDKNEPKVIRMDGLPPARAMICYEIAFPWEVAPGEDFSWIVNITNDGWFGNTNGPYQHFAMARSRAVEQGVAVVRAANTGISAIIDPYGRVLERLDLNDTGIIDGALPKPIAGRTPYGHYGEYIPMGVIVLFIGIGVASKRRNRKFTRVSS
ncbi:apolipoprotein N-acyltransferase [Sneathiella sp.]|uniref:apolipoprotein N-acyltransferase n=1 Tax=Sneathiella sp. TaxID=1964365 RepID=UPI00356209B2